MALPVDINAQTWTAYTPAATSVAQLANEGVDVYWGTGGAAPTDRSEAIRAPSGNSFSIAGGVQYHLILQEGGAAVGATQKLKVQAVA